MKKKKRSPSRIKYEENNPTVSARLPKEKRDRLLEMLKSTDMTLPQLLLHFIGEYQPKVKPAEEAYKKGHQAGYTKGFLVAKEKYAVKYHCNKCRKEITVTSEAEKKAIRQYMTDERWGHQYCPKD